MKQMELPFGFDVLKVGTKVRVKSKSAGDESVIGRMMLHAVCYITGYVSRFGEPMIYVVPKNTNFDKLVYIISEYDHGSGDYYLRKDLEVI